MSCRLSPLATLATLATLAVMMHSSCTIYTGSGEAFVAVTGIEVEDFEGNSSTNMEVEVHLYDFATDAFLGCAELREVDRGFTTYQIRELFELVDSPQDGFVRVIDIEDLDVYLWVVEKDAPRCPAPFDNTEDDIIGRSLPFPGVMLDGDLTLDFERVPFLELAPHETTAPR